MLEIYKRKNIFIYATYSVVLSGERKEVEIVKTFFLPENINVQPNSYGKYPCVPNF